MKAIIIALLVSGSGLIIAGIIFLTLTVSAGGVWWAGVLYFLAMMLGFIINAVATVLALTEAWAKSVNW